MRLFLPLLLLFAVPSASAAKVTAKVEWEHKKNCENAKGGGGALKLDAIKVVGLGPLKSDGSGEILSQYIFERPDKDLEDGSAQVKGMPAPDKNVKSWEVVFYVRLSGSSKAPHFFYGFDPTLLLWEKSTNKDPANLYRDSPFHLGSIKFTIDGKQKLKIDSNKSPKCQDPRGWIADHGIFHITKEGQFINMYYDPINGMFTPPV